MATSLKLTAPVYNPASLNPLEPAILDYLEALRRLHSKLVPSNYCEIGCRLGTSLALAKSPALGIDPDFDLQSVPDVPFRMFRMTSDDFFAQEKLGAILREPIDFAFIDGMHHVEFALRDFMNLEKHASPSSVIAVDDVLPQQMVHASRTRTTQIWTGDVYRLVIILRHYRPDLAIRVYDVEMKGFAVISRLDPTSTILARDYAEIESQVVLGRWSSASVDEIRRELQPRPIGQFDQDVDELAAFRRALDFRSGRPTHLP